MPPRAPRVNGHPRPAGAMVVLVVLVTTQLLPFVLVRAVALGVGLAWVTHRVASGMFAKVGDKRRIYIPLLPLFVFLMVVVSPAWSRLPLSSVFLAAQISSLVAIAVLLGRDLSWRQIEYGFAVSLATLMLLTLATESLGIRPTLELGVDDLSAWRGPFANPNLLAYSAVLSLVTFTTLTPDAGPLFGGWRRWLWVGLSLSVLMQTDSRGGYVYAGVSLLFIVVARTLRSAGNSHGSWLVLVSGAILGVGLGPVAMNRLTGLLGLDENPTLTGRTEIWDVGIAALADAPWLGYGLGSLRDPEAAQISPEMTHIWSRLDLSGFNSHNGYLDAALQVGVPVSALLTISIVAAAVQSLRRYLIGNSAFLWPSAMAVLVLAYNLTEVRLLNPALAFLVMSLVVLHHPRNQCDFGLETVHGRRRSAMRAPSKTEVNNSLRQLPCGPTCRS